MRTALVVLILALGSGAFAQEADPNAPKSPNDYFDGGTLDGPTQTDPNKAYHPPAAGEPAPYTDDEIQNHPEMQRAPSNMPVDQD